MSASLRYHQTLRHVQSIISSRDVVMVALEPAILRVRDKWRLHQRTLMWLAIAFMAVVAVPRLAYESWRLLGMPAPEGAKDLRLISNSVHAWFSGIPTFLSGYPPASFAMLWLPLGWLDVEPARWLWFVHSTALIALLAYWMIRASRAATRPERAFWIMTMLSIYPTAITLGNGQLGIHVLVTIIAGALLLKRGGAVTWQKDMFAAALWILSLVKLNLSAPFLWIVLFVPGRWRPVLLTAAGYTAVTLFGLYFQADPGRMLWDSFFGSIGRMKSVSGAANLSNWMVTLGWGDWMSLGSLALAGALGVWVYRNRRTDIWILLGVSAIVARIWMYHRMYDDLLILLPMVVLFRMAKSNSMETRSTVAGILFALGWIGLEMPGTLGGLSFPWNLPYEVGQTTVWTAMLVFLLIQPRRDQGYAAVPSLSSATF